MAKFKYLAVDDHGHYIRGRIEAPNLTNAMEILKGNGYWVIDLQDSAQNLLSTEIKVGSGPRVKTLEFTVFCRQLATMYRAGVSLADAVNIMSEQATSKGFRKVLAQIVDEMNSGMQFSDAASKHPTIFTSVFVNVVRAGEVSGELDEMLDRLALFFEKQYYTKQKVKSAMVYPAVMSIVMVIVITFLMIFVIPQYVDNFANMGVELPTPTLFIMGISEVVQRYWYFMPVVVIAFIFLGKILQKNKLTRYWLDYFKLKTPVFGQLWHKQAIARFARTFTSLYSAAIPMIQTLTITSKVVENDAIAKLILDSRESIGSGHTIAETLSRSWLFPPMVVRMMGIGEQSGSLDIMTEKVAEFYESEVDALADRLKSLLEPLMLLIIGGVVGGIVVAILLPMFQMIGHMPGM